MQIDSRTSYWLKGWSLLQKREEGVGSELAKEWILISLLVHAKRNS